MTAVPPRPAAPEVGRCGNTSPSFIGAPPDICALPAGHPGWHRGDLPMHGCATEWSDARPAAPDATAGDGLELQSQLYALLGGRTSTPLGAEWTHERLRRLVSTILALPALRDVLAAAARDAEKVRRVEELADEWAGHAWRNAAVFVPGTCADRIRRALDPS